MRLMALKKLQQIDKDIVLLLNSLDEMPPQSVESDELVSLLQAKVGERQILVEELLKLPIVETSEMVLTQQVDFTNSLSLRATKIMNKRKELLNQQRSNKRKISMYEYIDSNR